MWNDSDGGAGDREEEGGVSLREVEYDSGGIRRSDTRDHAKATALGRVICGIENEIERGLDVRGSERAAVMKTDIGPEVKDVGQSVGSVPGASKVREDVHLIVPGDKRGEDERVEVLRLAVGRKARVEIGRVGFDQKNESGGSGLGAQATLEVERKDAEEQRGQEKPSLRRKGARPKQGVLPSQTWLR